MRSFFFSVSRGMLTFLGDRNLGGTLLEGSDTSSATMQLIVMLLIVFPEEQEKLHAEIDKVIGSHRAPQWEDIPNLPYMSAFIEEVSSAPSRCLVVRD